MYIKKFIIHNFKKYKDFKMELTDQISVIIDNNSQGKTTLFEVINLALTGTMNNKNVLSEIPTMYFYK